MDYGSPIEFDTKALRDAGDVWVFTGYASVFNNVDLGNDRVAPGAFQKSCAAMLQRPSWRLRPTCCRVMRTSSGSCTELRAGASSRGLAAILHGGAATSRRARTCRLPAAPNCCGARFAQYAELFQRMP
jgi:hypothetical protein